MEPEAKLNIYGWCTRLDGTRIPVYYLYEIEDGKCQIVLPDTDTWLDLNESFAFLGGARANRPTKKPFECTEKAPRNYRA